MTLQDQMRCGAAFDPKIYFYRSDIHNTSFCSRAEVLAAQQNIAYGLRKMLFDESRAPAQSKLDIAREYAADVRAKNPSMQVSRIGNAATQNKSILDADLVPAGKAQRSESDASSW